MSRYISLSMIVLLAMFAFVQQSYPQPPEMQAILNDFDLTQAEIMQLGANIGGRMQELEQKFGERFREPPTLQNYRVKVGQMIDEVGPAVTDIVRGEVRDFLSADQYQKLETRVLQVHISMLRGAEKSENPETLIGNMPVGMAQMVIGPPSFLDFTEDQKQRLFDLQRRTLLDVVGGTLELQEKFPGANDNTPGLMEAVFAKFRPILLRFKRDYENILTDKQKAKIEEIMDDLPDYLWSILPENRGKERAWRPGANSWKPGDGAPEENPNKEARPERVREGRRFPGSE